jgi:DNA-binding response OmpR family regulator
MPTKRLLVVEDEVDINDMIVHHLKSEGYDVASALTAEDALESLLRDSFDLVILDILLPGMDGWELCEKIRNSENNRLVPIIFLSALSSEADRVKGFDLGCDDYLNKPFSPRELVSRVKAILRRIANNRRERTSMRMGRLFIDFLKHRIEVNGKPVHLTSSEFQLLNLLVRNEGRVYSRDELLSMMRENNFELDLGNVDVHVHHLRQKIEENPKKPNLIQTVWGVGYRFVSS